MEERRKDRQDRRSSERQGKYDRRRNRCGHCEHFEVTSSDPQQPSGLCKFHQQDVDASSFACPSFAHLKSGNS